MSEQARLTDSAWQALCKRFEANRPSESDVWVLVRECEQLRAAPAGKSAQYDGSQRMVADLLREMRQICEALGAGENEPALDAARRVVAELAALLIHARAWQERITALEWKVGEEERDFRRRAAEAGDIDEDWEAT